MAQRIWQIPKNIQEAEKLISGREGSVGGPASVDVGLRDAYLAGWFNQETGELYRGFPIGRDDVVVDVGCGEGGILSFCARQGAQVIGLDVDASAVEQAMARNSRYPKSQFHVASADALPVSSGSATRVICTEVLEHVEHPPAVLAELHRISKAGALVLLTVPDPASEAVQEKVAPPQYFQPPNHVRIFQRDEFASLVVGAGFEILSSGGFGFFWSVWWSMFWSCDADLDNPQYRALISFAAAWNALLSTKDGVTVQSALDSVMPKSQFIVARKPG